MAIPSSKATLIEWCVRKLGYPVIDINLDDDQKDDRVDEALQFFQEYHFDAVEKVYEKHEITQTDIDNEYISVPSEGWSTEPGGSGASADAYIGITKIFRPTTSSIGMWDIRYQMRLSDLTTFGTYLGGYQLLTYEMRMKNIALIEELLTGHVPVRFSKHKNRLNVDWDWPIDAVLGEFLVIEAFKILDPAVYPDVYNDYFLKQYTTALFKEQWGMNLSKFEGVQLPGGITLNGRAILEDAKTELAALREEMSLKYELPVDFMMA
tara:strand:+ start:8222 stop:9016 length:795 start_codon:yes stop_codon:yes gene_type:complete